MILGIRNFVLECWDHVWRERAKTTHIIVHRIEPELGENTPALAKAFQDGREFQAGYYTGKQFPYHFVIWRDGQIDQSLAILDTGPSAVAWNKRSISIATVGHFHKGEEPTPPQWQSLVNLCALLAWWTKVYVLAGHTELPHATLDPFKSCPGSGLSMEDLRSAVTTRLVEIDLEYDQRCRDLLLSVPVEHGGYGIVMDRLPGMKEELPVNTPIKT
jgi:N-acetyl-anhydromuramyl-L-alanine amidase AmpD